MRSFLALAAALLMGPAYAEVFEDVSDAVPLAPSSAAVSDALISNPSLLGALGESQLLSLGLRVDSQFVAGGAVEQGFSLPGVRLTAFGDIGDHIDYRLSLGQAREFTTVLLPTVIPVEGYVNLSNGNAIDPKITQRLRLRLGMFTPTFNPWWSPDLADVALPTYHAVDSILLISRDLGAEIFYEPFPDKLAFFAGYFNGTGIFAVNTNNSHTFTGGIRATIPVGENKLVLGASAYALDQASPSSVNYKSNAVADLYASLDVPSMGAEFTAEAILGSVEDSARTARPGGGAGTVKVFLTDGVKFFIRGETLRSSGQGSGTLDHFQLGPILQIHKSLTAYLLYDYSSSGGSNIDNQGLLRVRLVL